MSQDDDDDDFLFCFVSETTTTKQRKILLFHIDFFNLERLIFFIKFFKLSLYNSDFFFQVLGP